MKDEVHNNNLNGVTNYTNITYVLDIMKYFK